MLGSSILSQRNKEDRTFRDQVMTNGTLGYIAIPKNMSSSLLTAFRRDLGWEWSVVGKFDPEPVTFFGVVRDPVERWISGFTQSFHRGYNNMLKEVYSNLDPFVEDPWYDLHQAPQVLFVSGWPSPTLFKMENIDGLRDWLGDHNVVLPELIVKNTRDQTRDKLQLFEYLDKTLTEDQRQHLRTYYADDQELYDKAL
jgi:hypothetical protein